MPPARRRARGRRNELVGDYAENQHSHNQAYPKRRGRDKPERTV